MTVLQCGFIASSPGEPNTSKDISAVVPVEVSGDLSLSKLYAGGWGFGLASSADGKLKAWGVNQASLIGKSGSADDGADPNTLDILSDSVDAAAAGFDHGLVVQGGKLFAFGPSFNSSPEAILSPIDVPGKCFVAVAAGEHHSLALTDAGDVYSFGSSNREGQLGSGKVGEGGPIPVLVLGPGTGSRDASIAAPVVAIAAGARHSIAANSLGQCLAWGCSLHGQCGTGAVAPSVSSPTVVQALGPLKLVSVAGGMAHTVCLTDSGDVYVWGNNADGVLGNGTTTSSLTPLLVEALGAGEDSVVKVAAGARHNVALCASGDAFTWGYGKFGQLGTGSHEKALKPEKMQLPERKKVKDIAAGWWHTLVAVE